MPTTVWIDDRGLIRREVVKIPTTIEGEKVTAVMRIELLDVGEPQDVALPHSNQVYDGTDEAAEALGGVADPES